MLEQLQPMISRVVLPSEREVWKRIWKTPGVTPRVRMFFWRVLQKALPTIATLTKRISTIHPNCSICDEPIENASHSLFLCPHTRATWFLSSLGLRSSLFQQESIIHGLIQLWKHLDSSQIAIFMILAWSIWKARCARVFQQKDCVPEATIKESTFVALCIPSYSPPNRPAIPKLVPASAQIEGGVSNQEEYMAWVDGSFGANEQGGAAYVIQRAGLLLRYEIKNFDKAISHFHMEAMALLLAIEGALVQEIENCIFLTDSQLLADTFDPKRRLQPLLAADWRSYTLLVRIKNHLKLHPSYCCNYITREENQHADNLTNLARRQQFATVGFTFPLFSFL